MKAKIDLLVSDMAGTTVRDAGQVPQAFTAALAAHGIAVTPQAINSLRGASKRLAILNLVPEGPQRQERPLINECELVVRSAVSQWAGIHRADTTETRRSELQSARRLPAGRPSPIPCAARR